LAEALWHQAIALDPQEAQAHFNLGRLFFRRQRYDEAESRYRHAIALDPRNAGAHTNLGIVLSRRHQYDEAERCYRTALAIDGDNSAAHCNLGVLLARRGHDAAAESCYRHAIASDPRNYEAQSNLGALLARHGVLDEAEQRLCQAIALEPRHSAAHCNLALVLATRGKSDEAERSYRLAIELAPDRAEAYTNLGLLLERLNRDEEAERMQRQALCLNPTSAEIYSNLGNVLAKRGCDTEAEQCYREAIALSPLSPSGLTNLGSLLAARGKDSEAETCFRQAIAAAPEHPLSRLNLGYLLLGQGRLAEGWALHEARYAPNLANRPAIPPSLPFAQWQGEPLQGKSVVIWPEQGYGDEIQFCRFAPLLKEQGAATVTLVCKPALAPLMETLDGIDRVIAADPAFTEVGAHDYWTFPMSLPLRCNADLSNIPTRIPYLHALPDRIARWSARIPHGNKRVGLVWRGNARNPNDAHRSLPSLATLTPLWSLQQVHFVSLQTGPAASEARDQARQAYSELGSEIADFADTAAIVQQLDLLVCVDTAIAHLAGALGKPCWVLLPAHKTDWRWLRNREDSPWYPATMRLFRQRGAESWDSVIESVASALKTWLA
ncbi:MAG: pilus assembly protein PilF, partial [Proteobacteria bacterium]